MHFTVIDTPIMSPTKGFLICVSLSGPSMTLLWWFEEKVQVSSEILDLAKFLKFFKIIFLPRIFFQVIFRRNFIFTQQKIVNTCKKYFELFENFDKSQILDLAKFLNILKQHFLSGIFSGQIKKKLFLSTENVQHL